MTGSCGAGGGTRRAGDEGDWQEWVSRGRANHLQNDQAVSAQHFFTLLLPMVIAIGAWRP